MKLVSFTVTIKFGHDSPILVNMPPNEAMMLLSMSSLCDSVLRLVPNFVPDSPVEKDVDDSELPKMPKKEG